MRSDFPKSNSQNESMVRVLSIIGLFLCTTAIGQTFQNIRTRVDEDKIIIIYDLISLEPGSKVSVSLFSSHNNFESPLTDVTGDVGMVLPGPNRRISWKAGEQVTNAEQITFRFTGEIVRKLSFISPGVDGKIKRGGNSTITWQGGKSDEQVTITLVKPDEVFVELTKTDNTGSYSWKVPKKLKTGSGYSLRITGSENSSEQRFSVKRKVPIIWFAIPVVGTVIYFISTGADDGISDLPDAPSPN